MLVVLLVVAEVGNAHSPNARTAHALLIAVAMFRICIRAAALTDKCLNVSPLINSLPAELDLDEKRMYAVVYVKHSQPGFYICETRLTGAALLRTVYITC